MYGNIFNPPNFFSFFFKKLRKNIATYFSVIH